MSNRMDYKIHPVRNMFAATYKGSKCERGVYYASRRHKNKSLPSGEWVLTLYGVEPNKRGC